jgi:hypothetical protein
MRQDLAVGQSLASLSLDLIHDLRGEAHDPVVEGGMVHFDTALGHDLFQITIGDGIADVEKHRKQDHAFGVLRSCERYRHSAASYPMFRRSMDTALRMP